MMNKIKKIIIGLIVGIGLFPNIAFGAFGVPWYATSTTQGWIYPNPINGVFQTVVGKNYIATSTTDVNTFGSYIKIGNVIPLQSTGLGSDYTDLQIDKDRDDTVVMNIFNRSAGTSATSGLFLNNNNTTLGGAGLSAKYYAGFVLAGGNWDGTPYGLGALPKNGAVLYNTDAPIIIASPTSTGAIYMYTGAGSYAGSTPEMLINSSGNVGIGTSSPLAKLDIQGVNTSVNSRGNLYIHANSFSADYGGQLSLGGFANAGGVDTPFGGIAGRKSVGSGGYLSFMSAAPSTYTLTEYMRINENGNAGIGTSTPSARLDVYSTDQAILRADSNSTTGTRVIVSNSNNSSLNNNYGFVQGGTGVYKDKFQIARMNYNMGINSNIITMDSNSNVGIGTTSPLSRLHVVGANDFVYGQELTYPLWVSSPSNSLKSTIIGYNLDKDVGVIDAVDRGAAFKNLVLQSTGKFLGVGTTTPWGTLSVAGTNGQTTAVPVFVVSTSTSVFATTTALIVDGFGRVGVATKAPVTALTVGDGGLLQIPNGVGTTITPDILVTNSNATSGTASIAVGVNDGTRNRRVGLFYDDKNSIAGISTTYGGTSFPFIFRDAGGERIRLDTTGNVNIGTSTTAGQSAQLSIRNTGSFTNGIQVFSGLSNITIFSVNGTNGNVSMNGNLSATGGSITTVNGVFNSTAAVVPVLANGSASQTANLFEASKNLIKYTVIDSTGDVGAGTSTPMAKLSATAKTINETTFALQGLTGQTGNLISIYPSNSSTTVFSMNPTGGIFANSASTTLYFGGLLSSGTGNAVCITTNNQITNAGSGTCTPSSEKYKNSIKDFSGNALEELNKLKIVTFNYNDDVKTINEGDTKQRIGMIAEQVEKVDPRLVVHKDGSPNSLNDRDLLSLTIKALQEQQKQIDSLKAEIKRLNNK